MVQRLHLQLGRVNTNERIGDKRKIDEKGEHHIKFVEPREDPTEPLQPPKKPLDFIPLLVQFPVVFPGLSPITFRRNHGDTVQLAHQLTRLIPLISAIHDDIQGCQRCLLQQRPAFRSIPGVTRG